MGGDYGLVVIVLVIDLILEYFKDDFLKDFDKKKEIDDIFGIIFLSKEFN